MVIPYTKKGEDIRTILEADVNRRIAITKIKEAFDQRGSSTIDFVAKLKTAEELSIFTSDNQTDIKTQIVTFSGADIFVESEVYILEQESGTSVKLILTGFLTSTASSLSNKVAESRKFYNPDIGKLVSQAVEQIAEEFLNTMQEKFNEINNNGVPIIVDFSIAESSEYLMSTEVGPDELPLSDNIEIWMDENAYKNYYHIQGTTDLRMLFDMVRIPLKDPNTGNNYNTNKFALKIYKFIKSLGISCGKSIKGNTIYITIK
ncbi:MAG: DUF6175 family protein [Bacteroidales bacterium]|nr:DUF6175 family protein [Bacteroidales bacterium]